MYSGMATGHMVAGGMATGGMAAGGMATGGVAMGGRGMAAGTMAGGAMAGGVGTVPVGMGGVVVAGGEADCTTVMCGTGAGGAACMGCGTGAGCEVATGPAVMTFVGAGGDYVTETSYKYVGKGAGFYGMVAPKRSLLGYYICAISVVVLIVVAVLSGRHTCRRSQ